MPPFKGTEYENFKEYEWQLVSSFGVAGIQDADGHLYLHLLLKGRALFCCDQLPPNTRQDDGSAIASPRQRYVNPQRAALQRIIVFNQRKFRPSSETVDDFLRPSKFLDNRSPTLKHSKLPMADLQVPPKTDN